MGCFFSLLDRKVPAQHSASTVLYAACREVYQSVMEVRQMITMMINFRKYNKISLESWAGAYGAYWSSKKKNTIYMCVCVCPVN
jgi:hypothetical protein